ncbi:unnamed protein product, partial [Polarella glacialis]
MGYTKSVCTSLNNVIAHGTPDDRPLQERDILNLDVTVYINGFHGDTSSMFFAGRPTKAAAMLCAAAQKGMNAGIQVCGPGVDFREIGKAIERVSSEARYFCSHTLTGHGIGSYFHGCPEIIPQVNDTDQGLMKPGMTFTIEPIFVENNDTSWEIDPDGWTLRTQTGEWTAQFEHTILITETGHEVLTGPSVDYRGILAEKVSPSPSRLVAQSKYSITPFNLRIPCIYSVSVLLIGWGSEARGYRSAAKTVTRFPVTLSCWHEWLHYACAEKSLEVVVALVLMSHQTHRCCLPPHGDAQTEQRDRSNRDEQLEQTTEQFYRQLRLIPSGVQSWHRDTIAATDGAFAYSSTMALHIFRLKDKTLHKMIAAHERAISAICWSPEDSNLLASCSVGSRIAIWDIENEEELHAVKITDVPLLMDWASSGDKVAFATDTGHIMLWEYKVQKQTKLFSVAAKSVKVLRWHPRNANKLIVGLEDGSLTVYDQQTAKKLQIVGKAKTSKDAVTDAQWDPLSDDYLLVSFADGSLTLYDASNQKEIHSFDKQSQGINSMAWAKAQPGNFVTVTDRVGVLRLWNVSQRAPLAQIKVGLTGVNCVKAIPSEPNQFVLSFKNSSVGVCDIETRTMKFMSSPGHAASMRTHIVSLCQFLSQGASLNVSLVVCLLALRSFSSLKSATTTFTLAVLALADTRSQPEQETIFDVAFHPQDHPFWNFRCGFFLMEMCAFDRFAWPAFALTVREKITCIVFEKTTACRHGHPDMALSTRRSLASRDLTHVISAQCPLSSHRLHCRMSVNVIQTYTLGLYDSFPARLGLGDRLRLAMHVVRRTGRGFWHLQLTVFLLLQVLLALADDEEQVDICAIRSQACMAAIKVMWGPDDSLGAGRSEEVRQLTDFAKQGRCADAGHRTMHIQIHPAGCASREWSQDWASSVPEQLGTSMEKDVVEAMRICIPLACLPAVPEDEIGNFTWGWGQVLALWLLSSGQEAESLDWPFLEGLDCLPSARPTTECLSVSAKLQ